jgi:O-antigen ligase
MPKEIFLSRLDPSKLWLGCVVLYVALGPTHAPFYTPSLYDNSRLLQLFSLSVLCLLALAIPALRDEVARMVVGGRGLVRSGLYVLALLALASGLRAALPGMALQELALLLLLGFFTLTGVALATANRTLVDRLLLLAFQGSALVFMILFWIAHLAARETGQTFEWIHPFVTFANVRHFSQFQAYSLPVLVIPIAFVSLPWRWRVAAYLLAAHWWALQFAVGTRAVWFAGGCSALLLLLLLRRDAFPFLKSLGFAVAGGGLVYLTLDAFVFADAPGLADVGRRGFDTSKRAELWANALAMVRDDPFLGVGPMHFSFRNFEWAAHPHNTMLQLAAEYGLPVATITLALVASLVWECVRWARSASLAEDRLFNTGLLAALLMGLLDALVSGNTLMPVSQMSLFILMGWVIGRNRHVASNSPRARPATTTLAMSAIVVVSVITVGQGALAYYRYWDARQFLIPAGSSHPRYWEDGHWPAMKPAEIALDRAPLR